MFPRWTSNEAHDNATGATAVHRATPTPLVLVGLATCLLAGAPPDADAPAAATDAPGGVGSTAPDATAAPPAPVPPDDQVKACIQASVEGQMLRDRGQFVGARRQFVVCSSANCPGPIRTDCSKWLSDVDAKMPTIVLRVRDGDGRDVFDMTASIDGEPIPADHGGRAISVDPGPHQIRVERTGSAPVEERIMVREGEKYRPVDLVIAPPVAPALAAPEPESDDGGGALPTASWILGTVGILGVAGFAVLASSAKSERDELRDTCAPNCDPADVDAAQNRLLFANISLGVGVAALGAATWFALSSDDDPESPSTEVGIRASGPGAMAVVRGRF